MLALELVSSKTEGRVFGEPVKKAHSSGTELNTMHSIRFREVAQLPKIEAMVAFWAPVP